MTRLKLIITPLLVLSALLGISAYIFLAPKVVHADVMDDFNAEQIISDSNFIDAGSMNSTQIQNFLVQKGSVCLKDFKTLGLYDMNGDGLGDEPYGKGNNTKVSAATLIAQAAKLYNISPKVILVTLQKEQGLITRTDCPSWRYNTALGYGCPDTAPCDSSAYGFTRQIDYGVWHFRGFFEDSYPVPTKVPGSQYIAYNPTASCGGKTINVRNRATSALYSYTPYQPNKAAREAAIGETVPCGAYGNKNFYYYFSTWFGNPNHSTPFFKTLTSSKIYMHGANDTYYYVPNPDIFEAFGWGSRYKKVTSVSNSYLTNKSYAGSASTKVRFESSNVYLMDKGTMHLVSSPSMAATYGHTVGTETMLPSSHLLFFSTGAALQAIVRNQDNGAVYLLNAGKRRHFVSPSAMAGGSPAYSSRPKVDLSGDTVAALGSAAPIYASGSLFRVGSSAPVYLVNDLSTSFLIPSPALLSELGYNFKEVVSITPAAAQAYPNQGSMNQFVKTSDSSIRVLAAGRLIRTVSSEVAGPSGYDLTLSGLPTIDSAVFKRYAQTKPLTQVIRASGTPQVYHVSGGSKSYVASPTALHALGYDFDDVTDVSAYFLSLY